MIREEILRLSLPNRARDVKIVVSNLGLDIRLRGATCLAFRNSLADPPLLDRICNALFDDGGAASARSNKNRRARS